MLCFMKKRALLFLAINIFSYPSRANTPDECSAAISANAGVILWLVQVISAHNVAR